MGKKEKNEQKEVKKKSKKGLIITLSIIGVLLILFVVLVIIGSKEIKKQNEIKQDFMQLLDSIESFGINDDLTMENISDIYLGTFCEKFNDQSCAYVSYTRDSIGDITLDLVTLSYNKDGYTIRTEDGGTASSINDIRKIVNDTEFSTSKEIVF